jgi:putative oxidoreductase
MHLARTADRVNNLATAAFMPLQPIFLLGLRVYVSWQFLKSGWLKLQDWETTRYLFTEEYHVPVLSPDLAAVVGTAGEIIFPLLLIVGLLGRYAALGVLVVNVMAVVAYAHVLMSDGFEGAVGQHYLWGLMLVTLIIYGPGRLSIDALLAGRLAFGSRGHCGSRRASPTK